MAIIHALLALSSFAVVSDGRHCSSSGPSAGKGPVSVTFTATLIPPLKPMPIGRGKEFVVGDRMKRREFIALSIGGPRRGVCLADEVINRGLRC